MRRLTVNTHASHYSDTFHTSASSHWHPLRLCTSPWWPVACPHLHLCPLGVDLDQPHVLLLSQERLHANNGNGLLHLRGPLTLSAAHTKRRVAHVRPAARHLQRASGLPHCRVQDGDECGQVWGGGGEVRLDAAHARELRVHGDDASTV